MTSSEDATTQSAQRVVASYSTHHDAEDAVTYLSEQGFLVQHTAIVGRGLEMVENVIGRVGYATAAAQGAVTGAVVGAVSAWLFGIFSWIDPLVTSFLLAVYGALVGLVIGALVGLIVHAVSGRRQNFSTHAHFRASAYDVLADADVADEAADILRKRSE